ncbi:MAG: hypothetical protein MUP25_06960 [Syntrophales bacterium]|nr:hypothetical protein [Syntrophales bacterium]
MGTLIVLAVILLGVFLGIVLFSLLSLAQKGEEIYNLMDRGEEIATPADTYSLPASETLLPTSSGEARPQRDLRATVAAH